MTLTGRLAPETLPHLRDAAARHFAHALAAPRAVAEICIVTEAAAGTPMLIAERLALRT